MRRVSASRIAITLMAMLGAASSWAESLTVVSWGGSYAEACEEAYLKPFSAETGIQVLLTAPHAALRKGLSRPTSPPV